jgi:starch synthase
VQGRHDFIPRNIRHEVTQKKRAECAVGILNAPDPIFDPATDPHITHLFDATTVDPGKSINKREFQKLMGLDINPDAPLFFWPSRLDPVQKGPELLAHILYDIVHAYYRDGLQVAIVANGAFQRPFRNVVAHHDFPNRVAVCDFNERLSHLGYAASDFVLMPSRFEPCGLPQMIAALFGSLTVAHDTGGLHDSVEHLDESANSGNGFLFNVYDAQGLRWAIDQAMQFSRRPASARFAQLSRVMREAKERFNHGVTAERYFDIYAQMLNRPVIPMV